MRSCAVVATVAVVLASCGSGDDLPGVPAAETAPTSQPDGAVDPDDPVTTDPTVAAVSAAGDPTMALAAVAAEADRLAGVLVERFGSDDAASAALLRAIRTGYSGDQVRAAIDSGSLQVDGSIADTTPDGRPSDLIVGLRAPPTPVEELTEQLKAAAGAGDVMPVGTGGTALLVGLMIVGFDADQIVEAVVFGVDKRPRTIDEVGALRPDCESEVAGEFIDTRLPQCVRWWEQCSYEWTIAGEVVDLGACRPVGGNGEASPESDDATTEETTTVPTPPADYSGGAWTGSATGESDSESLSSFRSGSAVVELRDGVYTASFEQSGETFNKGHDGCTTSTTGFGQMEGTADEYGRIVFTGDITTELVSDCPFYESSGGVDNETKEGSLVGRLRDDGAFELENVVPGETIVMTWTAG